VIWWFGKKLIVTYWRCTLSRPNFPNRKPTAWSPRWRRAAISIPANIAEGFRRRGKAEKVRFLIIAEASLEESRYYLILAEDLGYGQTQELMDHLEEVSRLVSRYSAAILTSGS